MHRYFSLLLICVPLAACQTAQFPEDSADAAALAIPDPEPPAATYLPALSEQSLYVPFDAESLQTALITEVGDSVFFAFDSDQLDSASQETIVQVANWMDAHPTTKVLLEGHTDPSGSPHYNFNLSLKRAINVRDSLVALGVSSDRLYVQGWGDVRPLATAFTSTVWGANRRVTFVPRPVEIPKPRLPIQVSVRAPLWPQKSEEDGFGLYSYLLFGSKSEANRPRRMAAARAYLANIETFSYSEQTALPRNRQNIFYVPLRYYDPSTYAFDDVSAEALVCSYHYWRARAMLSAVRAEGDGIYLVAVANKLSELTLPEDDEMLIWNIDKTGDYDLIELRLNEFKRQLRKVEFSDDASLRNLMTTLREFIRLGTLDIQIVSQAWAALRGVTDIRPATEPAPLSRKFAVFFASGSATLSDSATHDVARAAAYADQLGLDTVSVLIVGHADSVGGSQMNAELSDRRAKAVRNELKDLGVPLRVMNLRAFGEDAPVNPTPDGVSEKLNRVVEITVSVDPAAC